MARLTPEEKTYRDASRYGTLVVFVVVAIATGVLAAILPGSHVAAQRP